MKSVAVFCGSNFGKKASYLDSSIHLAEVIVRLEMRLIYGGGAVGLMGAVANKVLELGGEVIGVIPKKLSGAEIAHSGLTALHVVDTMHERKAMMAELADCFIALPGGIGTLEEIIEVFTWTQLGFHSKPCGILNITGFYDKFHEFLAEMSEQGFISEYHLKILISDTDPERLLFSLRQQKLAYKPKWIK
jgi:uncharacterized protein (TIGR00730 family)